MSATAASTYASGALVGSNSRGHSRELGSIIRKRVTPYLMYMRVRAGWKSDEGWSYVRNSRTRSSPGSRGDHIRISNLPPLRPGGTRRQVPRSAKAEELSIGLSKQSVRLALQNLFSIEKSSKPRSSCQGEGQICACDSLAQGRCQLVCSKMVDEHSGKAHSLCPDALKL